MSVGPPISTSVSSWSSSVGPSTVAIESLSPVGITYLPWFSENGVLQLEKINTEKNSVLQNLNASKSLKDIYYIKIFLIFTIHTVIYSLSENV